MSDCAEKHCDEPAAIGMTWRFGEVRIEFYVCERHFDAIGAAEDAGVDLPPVIRTEYRGELGDLEARWQAERDRAARVMGEDFE